MSEVKDEAKPTPDATKEEKKTEESLEKTDEEPSNEQENKKEENTNASPVPSSSDASAAAIINNEADKISKQIENLTIFGNKSLEELHRIQAQKSHLSAGILFTDPALRM